MFTHIEDTSLIIIGIFVNLESNLIPACTLVLRYRPVYDPWSRHELVGALLPTAELSTPTRYSNRQRHEASCLSDRSSLVRGIVYVISSLLSFPLSLIRHRSLRRCDTGLLDPVFRLDYSFPVWFLLSSQSQCLVTDHLLYLLHRRGDFYLFDFDAAVIADWQH